MSETKEQILEAAESLFSEHGIEAVPLRRIIAAAGVNSAAIHYHFGSKQELVRAVFAHRFGPINAERIRLLDEAARHAAGRRPSLEEVLYAIVAPPFLVEQGDGGGRLRRLAGRLLTERPGYMEVIVNDLFGEVERRFDAALRGALPELSETECSWRKYMAIGSMIFVMREQEWIQKASRGLCDADADIEGTIERLMRFMAAGMRASRPPGTERAEVAVTVERRSR